MQIGFDLDDTIIDHMPNRISLARTFRHEINEETINDGRARALFSDADFKKFNDTLYMELSLSAQPMEESLQTMNHLIESGHSIHIISLRYPGMNEFARVWIGHHLPQITSDRIHFVNHNSEKSGLAKYLGLELFLDNNIDVLASLPATTKPLLFDKYERVKSSPYPKVASWREFEHFLHSLRR